MSTDNKYDPRQEYIDERNLSILSEKDFAMMYDKSILTLSSASFGFTLILLNNLENKDCKVLLALSCFLILFTVLLIIYNIYRTTKYQQVYRKILDKKENKRFNYDEAIDSILSDLQKKKYNIGKWIKYRNLLILSLFGLGMTLLIIFLIINL